MKKLIIILLTAVTTFAFGCATDDGIKVITVKEFADAMKTDTTAVILDVRTAEEYANGHIEGSINLDIKDEAAFDRSVKSFDNSKTYYIYCRSGRRSHKAAAKIQNAGFNAIDMEGGINAWNEEKLPVVVSLK